MDVKGMFHRSVVNISKGGGGRLSCLAYIIITSGVV